MQTDVRGILSSLLGGGMSYVEKLEKHEEGNLNDTIGQRESHEWKTFLEGDFNSAQEN